MSCFVRPHVCAQIANSQGIYAVKFFTNGEWRAVIVDDRYLATVRSMHVLHAPTFGAALLTCVCHPTGWLMDARGTEKWSTFVRSQQR